MCVNCVAEDIGDFLIYKTYLWGVKCNNMYDGFDVAIFLHIWIISSFQEWANAMARRSSSVRPSVCLSVCKLFTQIASSRRQMAGSLPNLHTMDSRSACIQGVLKVKVKVKGHVIRALSWILGMSYSVIDGLVVYVVHRANLYRMHVMGASFSRKSLWRAQ